MPPAPVQVRVYVTVPGVAGVTEAEPLVVSLPDQSPSVELAEALQEVALVLDQVSMVAWPRVTEGELAERATVGIWGRVLEPPLQVLKKKHKEQQSRT